MTVLDKAIIFATEAHSGTYRKGGKTPFVVHPLEAAAIAASMTDDEEIIAAAVLHDVVEDTPATIEEMKNAFGERVAKLVVSDSEDKRENMPKAESWEIRKRETLESIPNAGREEQIIVLSDKLSNLRSIYRDYTKIGDELWNRFNVKDKEKHKWYYCGVAEKLNKVKDTCAFKEYVELLFAVFHWDELGTDH